MAASTMIGTVKKQKQIGILVVLEAQEIDFRGTLKANMMNIVISMWTFFVLRKIFLSYHSAGLPKYVYPNRPNLMF